MKRLKYITCSGANESTDIAKLIALSVIYPIVEWGIQVSGKKCSFGSARYEWICALQQYMERKGYINLALHINQDWVEGFTAGKIPEELNVLLEKKNIVGKPFFSDCS